MSECVVLILSVVAIAFMVAAFASPYWIESFAKSENPFVKAGIWEFCFNEYTFYKDYNGKIYTGCWYIFSDQYRSIWEWLSPPWFIAVEVMVSACLLIQGLVTIIVVMLNLNLIPTELHRTLIISSSVTYIFVDVLILITGIIYGVKKEDRDWMPRPDQNFLSWSYGFFIISGFFTLFAALLLLWCLRKNVEFTIISFDTDFLHDHWKLAKSIISKAQLKGLETSPDEDSRKHIVIHSDGDIGEIKTSKAIFIFIDHEEKRDSSGEQERIKMKAISVAKEMAEVTILVYSGDEDSKRLLQTQLFSLRHEELLSNPALGFFRETQSFFSVYDEFSNFQLERIIQKLVRLFKSRHTNQKDNKEFSDI